ncbi:hypothetical protein IFM89_006990 [Coptis chinensis]|uniref:Uncharacterized protein n=1 Tax=Coptis chinensis TaxID=261450 RepID=A0A835LHS8_9MAGN|nr:hypothetical protein IFM89_006990 [Coptis chinensis]
MVFKFGNGGGRPKGIDGFPGAIQLIELGGFLSILQGHEEGDDINDFPLDVWVLKDINTGKWERKFRIDSLPEYVHKDIGSPPPFCWNNLNSQIPESFKNLQSLSYLSLSNTSIHNISVALAGLQQCENLKTLVLTQNFQSEVMPAVEDLKFENLTTLVIAYCGLTGSIP